MRSFGCNLFKVSAFFFLLWAGGLVLFFSSIPQFVEDTQTPTQAIVVLTGGRERLKTGFQLLCADQAQMIYISGVHPGETLKSILKIFEGSGIVCSRDRERLVSNTYLGYATNTRGNAIEVADWVKKQRVLSFRLVTAAYHMPRSLLEVKYLLPDILIIPHPVFPNGFNRSNWWHKLGIAVLILSEYHKYLGAFVRRYLTLGSKNFLGH